MLYEVVCFFVTWAILLPLFSASPLSQNEAKAALSSSCQKYMYLGNEIIKASQVVHEGPPHKQEKRRKELTDLRTKVHTYMSTHEGSVCCVQCVYDNITLKFCSILWNN